METCQLVYNHLQKLLIYNHLAPCRVAENPVETCQLVYNHLQKLLAIITPKMEESKGQSAVTRAHTSDTLN